MQKAARSFDQNVVSKLKALPEYKKEEVCGFLVDKTRRNVKAEFDIMAKSGNAGK